MRFKPAAAYFLNVLSYVFRRIRMVIASNESLKCLQTIPPCRDRPLSSGSLEYVHANERQGRCRNSLRYGQPECVQDNRRPF